MVNKIKHKERVQLKIRVNFGQHPSSYLTGLFCIVSRHDFDTGATFYSTYDIRAQGQICLMVVACLGVNPHYSDICLRICLEYRNRLVRLCIRTSIVGHGLGNDIYGAVVVVLDMDILDQSHIIFLAVCRHLRHSAVDIIKIT